MSDFVTKAWIKDKFGMSDYWIKKARKALNIKAETINGCAAYRRKDAIAMSELVKKTKCKKGRWGEKAMTAKQELEAIELYRRGNHIREIAKAVGSNYDNVRVLLGRYKDDENGHFFKIAFALMPAFQGEYKGGYYAQNG